MTHNLTYIQLRQQQKLVLKPTAAEEKRAQPKKSIPKKSAKTVEREKKEKTVIDNLGRGKLGKFFAEMIRLAPDNCMETGQPLINTAYGINPAAIVAHILPKRSVIMGGVPSMATNPLNIVYLDGDIHTKFDADMGTKSKGKYVKSMKIYPLLKQRVSEMLPMIPDSELKNIPEFLLP